MLDTSKIYKSNNCGKFRITNYKNALSVDIEFLSTGYKSTVYASQIKNNEVLDRLYPSICGIGFVGSGVYPTAENGKITKAYNTWRNILKRCYCEKTQVKQPTYIGCSVDTIWHEFQSFAEWFDKNHIEGYHLDKDIKIKGNKVYSPETCIFVSRNENNVEARAKHYVFIDPDGNEVKIYNMTEFCRNKNLSRGHMSSVSIGARKHHRGWTKG